MILRVDTLLRYPESACCVLLVFVLDTQMLYICTYLRISHIHTFHSQKKPGHTLVHMYLFEPQWAICNPHVHILTSLCYNSEQLADHRLSADAAFRHRR